MKRKSLSASLAVVAGIVLALLGTSRSAKGQAEAERIRIFHSDLTVSRDASMQVRETIKVQATGDQIKRGIYRDFPTRYTDRLGRQYTVGFEVVEVLRDGQPEPYHLESLRNGKRVYIGAKSVFLNPGEYTYTLAYRTDRQLGFFPDHDELYWNVTGNGWGFPIDEASAAVTLPKGIKKDALLLDAYTGPQGAVGTAFQSSVDPDGTVRFVTTQPLAPYEGLTLVVGWPKGFVSEPTRERKLRYFLQDNRGLVLGLAGLVMLLAYYLLVWARVGKDPARGIIMPLYLPPEGLSPAAVRHLANLGFDHKTFAAALINMAVKKYLTIHEKHGVYTLTKGQGENAVLAPEEKLAAGKLLDAWTKTLELNNTHHSRISGAIEALKNNLKYRQEKIYFLTNRPYLIPGLAGSGLLLIVSVGLGSGESPGAGMFAALWLAGWSFGVVFLMTQVVRLWKGALLGRGHRLTSLGSALFMSLFALPFLGGEGVGLFLLGQTAGWTVLIVLGLTVFINYLFHYLLKAPTHAGRKLLDKIEGFKMFLAAVEQDRLNVLYPVKKTPELFEKYLPYALALDVEQAWSEQFAEVLATAGEGGQAYSPIWYSGTTSWADAGPSGFASSLGNSFSSAISSASTAPGSRSGFSGGGGGGGSSGGGGGGGGGGGW